MGANEPQGVAILDPRGMIGRIYVGDHLTLLHTNVALGLIVSEKKIFEVFPIISLWELYVAMATRIPILLAPKSNAAFPPT